MCLEGFLYGKILPWFVPLLLVTKQVQLFLAPGVYSGIFAIYLQWTSNESSTRTPNVVFYILCILYVLSAVTFVCDLLQIELGVSD